MKSSKPQEVTISPFQLKCKGSGTKPSHSLDEEHPEHQRDHATTYVYVSDAGQTQRGAHFMADTFMVSQVASSQH